MYKLSRQELYNNISYNNDVITTTLQHVEKNDIVTTLFRNFQANSGTFSNIQPSSGKLRDIEGYCGIFRHYRGVWSHDQKYAELCVIHACTTVKQSEPWLVQNPRHLQNPLEHIRGSRILRALAQSKQFIEVFSRIFWHIQ